MVLPYPGIVAAIPGFFFVAMRPAFGEDRGRTPNQRTTMRNITSQMIDDAESAYYRAAGESCRISGIRAALHTIPTAKMDDVTKICLRTALEALIELSRQRNENCDHIVATVEQLIADVEALS